MKGPRSMLNVDTLHAVRQSLKTSLSEVPRYTSTVKNRVFVRISDANVYYKRVTGMDELDRCQERVTTLQDKLYEAQETRRQTGQELAEVRKKSNELQDQLHKVKRQDNLQRFLDLMKEETELLKREQDIAKTFGDQDRAEREIFTSFTNAIRDSHEKQRTHLERTKYWGMILSIVGSFVSFTLSSLRTEELKQVISKQMLVNHEPVVNKLEQNERLIESTMQGIRAENGRLLEALTLTSTKQKFDVGLIERVVRDEVKATKTEVLNVTEIDVDEEVRVGNNDDWGKSVVGGFKSEYDTSEDGLNVVKDKVVVKNVITYSILVLVGVCFVKLLSG